MKLKQLKSYPQPEGSQFAEEATIMEVTPRFRVTPAMFRSAKSMPAQVFVTMPPEEFLKLTTSQDRSRIERDALSLVQYNRFSKIGDNPEYEKFVNRGKERGSREYTYGSSQHPFLEINLYKNKEGGIDGRVIGHEGRHRAMAYMKKGGKEYPVALLFRNDSHDVEIPGMPSYDSPKYYFNVEHLPKYIRAQFSPEWVSTRNWKVTHDVPLRRVQQPVMAESEVEYQSYWVTPDGQLWLSDEDHYRWLEHNLDKVNSNLDEYNQYGHTTFALSLKKLVRVKTRTKNGQLIALNLQGEEKPMRKALRGPLAGFHPQYYTMELTDIHWYMGNIPPEQMHRFAQRGIRPRGLQEGKRAFPGRLKEAAPALPSRFFWHPQHGVLTGDGHHTHMLWANPDLFGFSPERIETSKRHLENIANQYDPKLVQEAINQGWIRVTRIVKDYSLLGNTFKQMQPCSRFCNEIIPMERLFMDALEEHKHVTLHVPHIDRFLRSGRIAPSAF